MDAAPTFCLDFQTIKIMDNSLNLFWAVIWAVVLVCTVAGLFGKNVPLIILAVLAAGMLAMFIVDYIKVRRLR